MDVRFTYISYVVAAVLLLLSFRESKQKSVLALRKAYKMFITVLPQFLAILFLVGLILAIIKPNTIQMIIGTESGVEGMVLSAILGSATLIPVLIAFPIAANLLENGAGVMQIAVFISTLTTVGFATIPLEIKYFGKKITLLRNLFALLLSFVIALIMGVLL